MVGYHGIQFQEDSIELGVHGSLGRSKVELSCGEVGHGSLEAV